MTNYMWAMDDVEDWTGAHLEERLNYYEKEGFEVFQIIYIPNSGKRLFRVILRKESDN